jgi:hypothetical protein
LLAMLPRHRLVSLLRMERQAQQQLIRGSIHGF